MNRRTEKALWSDMGKKGEGVAASVLRCLAVVLVTVFVLSQSRVVSVFAAGVGAGDGNRGETAKNSMDEVQIILDRVEQRIERISPRVDVPKEESGRIEETLEEAREKIEELRKKTEEKTGGAPKSF